LRISDERMIEALITTESITKCAEVLGCNRKSIYDRLKKPEFYAKLQQQRKDSFALATSKVTNAQEQAVQTLIDIMNSADASDGCRIRACQIILDTCVKVTQQVDVIDQIHELKQMMKMQEM
jgi:hypothetical protein